MKSGLKIEVISEPDGDELYFYGMSISNGVCSTYIEFYGYKDEFQEFAESLITFPKNLCDTALFELGEERGKSPENWAYYILLKAFCYGAAGESALHIIVDNNTIAPYHHRNEFFIILEPAAINRLGANLKNWNPEHEQEFDWVLM